MTDVDKLTNIKDDFEDDGSLVIGESLDSNFALLKSVKEILPEILASGFETTLKFNFEQLKNVKSDIDPEMLTADGEVWADPTKIAEFLSDEFMKINSVTKTFTILNPAFKEKLDDKFNTIGSVEDDVADLGIQETILDNLNVNFTEIKKKVGLTYIPHPEDGTDSPIRVDLLHTGWVKPDNKRPRPNVNDPDNPSILETCEGVIAAQQMVSVDIPAPGSLNVTYTDIVIKPHVEWTPENVKMNMEIARCGVELGEQTDWDKLRPGSNIQTKKLYLLFRAVNAWPTEDIRFDLVLY